MRKPSDSRVNLIRIYNPKTADYRVQMALRFILALSLLVSASFITSSCGSLKQLKAFKEHHQAGDFQWIASQPVDCKPEKKGCNQLHLIKGNACLVRATEAATKPEKKELYTCAADELQSGIQQTTEWTFEDVDLNRAQTYENLCQALRNLHDLQVGEESIATADRFLATAEQFKRLEPENFAARYYVSLARFRKIFPELLTADESNSERLCNILNNILNDVVADIAAGQANPNPLWERYKTNFGVLKGKIVLEQENLPNCP